jgi:glycine/D-amino acid oxidase-like deaminating enzyme
LSDFQVLVLGGGIAGCVTASILADDGFDVAIVEQQPDLMNGASRWNDGKLHMGYTYTASASPRTAALMIEGVAAWIPTMERILGVNVDDSWWGRPVTYLVDAGSILSPDVLWPRAQAVARLLGRSAERLPELRRWLSPQPLVERLDLDEAAADTGQAGFTAAWRTTERHVSAGEVAMHMRAAVSARPITLIHAQAEGITPAARGWRVALDGGRHVNAQVVVNCLWENLVSFNRQVDPGFGRDVPMVIRYKACLFGTNAKLKHLNPSTRIVGKFGDVATYPNGDAYLSWYPAALRGRSDDGSPPPPPKVEPAQVIEATLAGLRLPPSTVAQPGASWRVHGGYIIARGDGDIDRPRSLLHSRDMAAVVELRPGFISVDTGKYTLGPMLARQAAEVATRRLAFENRRSA